MDGIQWKYVTVTPLGGVEDRQSAIFVSAADFSFAEK